MTKKKIFKKEVNSAQHYSSLSLKLDVKKHDIWVFIFCIIGLFVFATVILNYILNAIYTKNWERFFNFFLAFTNQTMILSASLYITVLVRRNKSLNFYYLTTAAVNEIVVFLVYWPVQTAIDVSSVTNIIGDNFFDKYTTQAHIFIPVCTVAIFVLKTISLDKTKTEETHKIHWWIFLVIEAFVTFIFVTGIYINNFVYPFCKNSIYGPFTAWFPTQVNGGKVGGYECAPWRVVLFLGIYGLGVGILRLLLFIFFKYENFVYFNKASENKWQELMKKHNIKTMNKKNYFLILKKEKEYKKELKLDEKKHEKH